MVYRKLLWLCEEGLESQELCSLVCIRRTASLCIKFSVGGLIQRSNPLSIFLTREAVWGMFWKYTDSYPKAWNYKILGALDTFNLHNINNRSQYEHFYFRIITLETEANNY